MDDNLILTLANHLPRLPLANRCGCTSEIRNPHRIGRNFICEHVNWNKIFLIFVCWLQGQSKQCISHDIVFSLQVLDVPDVRLCTGFSGRYSASVYSRPGNTILRACFCILLIASINNQSIIFIYTR